MNEVKEPEKVDECRKSNEIKIPDIETDWKSFDIYLFSNGQQYSPPRKYHLKGDDLQWWDTTLNYLARTHYGPTHAKIDLYSTNGRRVNTPLELANGVAYVAVEPPDAFINSGYDKYLVKASRSLEKRQPKKSPDDIAETVELISDRRKSDKLNPTDVIETVFTSPSVVQMSEFKLNGLDRRRQNEKITKTSDKRRFSNLQRQTPHRSPTTAKKVNGQEKGNLPWKSSKVPNKPSYKIGANTVDRVANLPSKDKPIKTPHKTIESAPKEVAPTEVEDIKINAQPPIQTAADGTRTSVLLKTNDSIASKPEDKDIPVTILNNTKSINEQTAKKSDPPQESAKAPHIGGKYVDNNFDEIAKCTLQQDIIPNGKQNDRFTALINRGDIINFSLNIEIRNADGTLTNHNMSRSYTNLLKNDKFSQVTNIEQEIFINSKSWQSMFPSETITDHNTKVFIVKCACCEKYCTNLNIGTEGVSKETKKCIMFMPPDSRRPNRCPCNDDGPTQLEKIKDNRSHSEYSVINPITRTLSIMSLERAKKKSGTDDLLPEQLTTTNELDPESKNIPIKLVDHTPKGLRTESRVNFVEPSNDPNGETQLSTDAIKNVAGNQNPEKVRPHNATPETIVPNLNSIYTTDDREIPDIVVVRKISGYPNSKCVADASTQTDWEDIVLVARQHENGRYSFHLPPLSAVKHF